MYSIDASNSLSLSLSLALCPSPHIPTSVPFNPDHWLRVWSLASEARSWRPQLARLMRYSWFIIIANHGPSAFDCPPALLVLTNATAVTTMARMAGMLYQRISVIFPSPLRTSNAQRRDAARRMTDDESDISHIFFDSRRWKAAKPSPMRPMLAPLHLDRNRTLTLPLPLPLLSR